MQRACCKNEIDYIYSSKEPASAFVKLWTLKESYVKYLGTSVFDDMSAYDFSAVAQDEGGGLFGCDFSVLDVGECVISSCSSTQIEQKKRVSLAELVLFCSSTK